MKPMLLKSCFGRGEGRKKTIGFQLGSWFLFQRRLVPDYKVATLEVEQY